MTRHAPVLFVAALLVPVIAPAQHVQLVQIEADSFPTIRGYLAPVGHDPGWNGDLASAALFENGSSCPLLSVDCPDQHAGTPLASVVALDVSESMGVWDPALSLARHAADRWIQRLALGTDRCALVSFDDAPRLLLPWSTDGETLHRTIDALRPGGGGTFYTAALADPPDGALHVASGASGRRVILMITDGGGTGDLQAIIRLTRREGVVIHVIVVARAAGDLARRVASESGGVCLEGLTTPSAIDSAIDRIADGCGPDRRCRVRWTSRPGCERSRFVRITMGADHGVGDYVAPPRSTPSLSVEPPVLELPYGADLERQALLRARGGPIHVRHTRTDHPDIKVEAPTPFTIKDGDAVPLRLVIRRSDSSALTARIVIESDACRPVISAVRMEGEAKFSIPTALRLIRPNGGEVFQSGLVEEIAWEGSEGAPVRVDISVDGGGVWRTIVEGEPGGRIAWRVPATPGNRALARIGLDPASSSRLLAPWDTGNIFFSDDGSLVVGQTRLKGVITVWDVDRSRVVDRLQARRLIGIGKGGREVHLLLDSLSIATWDVERGEVAALRDISLLGRHGAYEFSSDLKRCATADWLGRDSTIITLWSLDSITVLATWRLPGTLSPGLSPDGERILAAPLFGDSAGWVVGDSARRHLSLAGMIGPRFSGGGRNLLWYARSLTLSPATDSAMVVGLDTDHGTIVVALGPFEGRPISLDVAGSAGLVALLLDRGGKRESLVMRSDGTLVGRWPAGGDARRVVLGEGGRLFGIIQGDRGVEIGSATGALLSDESDSLWSIAIPSIHLAVRDTFGWIGRSEMIRVESSAPTGLRLPYRCRLAVRPPILLPEKASTWVDGEARVIEIEGVFEGGPRGVFIPVTPLLGPSQEGVMEISEFVWLDADGGQVPADISCVGGRYRLLGFCPLEGGRLVRDDVAPTLRARREGTELVILWEGFDDAGGWLDIHNLPGELLFRSDVRGRHGRCVIDARMLPVGVVIARMKIGSGFVSTLVPGTGH